MKHSARVDMIGLTTADMGRSLAFYRLLGLDVADPPPARPYVETTLAGGIRLSWNSAELMKQILPDHEAPRGQRMTLAFLCDGPAAVDALYAAVVAAGHEGIKAPWDAFWGQRYAIVRDPDGNAVDLFAPLAG